VQRIEYDFVDALYLTRTWRQADGGEQLPLLARYFREALGLTEVYSAIVEHSYPSFAGTSHACRVVSCCVSCLTTRLQW
jgi:hypothetical protein